MNGSGIETEPSRAAETPHRKTGLSRPRFWFVAGLILACVVGAGMRMIGRGGTGNTAETAEQYAARIASRDNLARFGFVRAELARDAGDADAAAALTMLETQFDSNGILDWLIAKAETEPENIEIRREIANLACILYRDAEAKIAIKHILELDGADNEARRILVCLLWDPASPDRSEDAFIQASGLIDGPETPCETCEYDHRVGRWSRETPPFVYDPADEIWFEVRYMELLGQYQRSGDLEGQARISLKLGALLSRDEDKEPSIEYFHSALNLYEKIRRMDAIAKIHERHGRQHDLYTSTELRKDHFERAIACYQLLGCAEDITVVQDYIERIEQIKKGIGFSFRSQWQWFQSLLD